MKETVKIMVKKSVKWFVLLICVIIFFTLLDTIFEQEKMRLDTMIYQIIVVNLRTEPLTLVLKGITHLGGAYVLIGISLLSLILMNNKKIAIHIPLNLILATLLNIGLKNIIQRPRPEGYRLISESGFSFPSGHSMVSMAFYGLLIYLIGKKVKNKKVRNGLCIFLGFLIFMIGFSRIYLGVHYASDVIGGFVISVVYLILYTTIVKLVKEKEEIKEENETGKKEKN